jgi:beta-1,4-mannosyl-glycoprotein beta-1,4-N-acetylglucosaminyltransferase
VSLRKKRQPRIYDTFIFGDELDVLECRLTEYEDTPIYRHVIVEADVDHQGHPKPYYFLEHKERFAPWLDRITYIQMTGLGERYPAVGNPNANWARIYAQRDELTKGLKGIRKDDVILFGDCDEILNPEGVNVALQCSGQLKKGIRFAQRMAVFCVDWEDMSQAWRGPVAVHYGQAPKQFHDTRDSVLSNRVSYGAGWHLSWLGGPEMIKRKVSHYCHPELDDYILKNLESGRLLEQGYYWGEDTVLIEERKLIPVQVDQNWPKWIKDRKCPGSWFRDYYETQMDTPHI